MSLSVTMYRRGGLVSVPGDTQDYAAGNAYGRNVDVATLQQGQSNSVPDGETPAVVDSSGRIVRNVTPYGEQNNSFFGALREGVGGLILALAGGAYFAPAAAAEAGATDAAATDYVGDLAIDAQAGSDFVGDLPIDASAGTGSDFVGDLPIDASSGTDVSPLAQYETVPTIVQPSGGTIVADNFVGDLPIDAQAGSDFVGDLPVDAGAGAGATSPGVSFGDINNAISTAKSALGVASAARAAFGGGSTAPNNTATNGKRSDVAPLAGSWFLPGTANGSHAPATASSPWILPAIVGGFLLIVFLFLARR